MIQTVGTEKMAEVAGRADAVIVDVRQPEEYASRHIKGAVLAPHTDIESHLGDLPRDKDLYLTCEVGARSAYACEYLEAAGFTRLFNVVPGMSTWRGPVEKGLPPGWK
ncbi:MAG: rhodanese-like domain-containing protein [Planctomycetes bacterium]|nr:rhodanese-like domain-containing protein [Planctomycetota bacterium]